MLNFCCPRSCETLNSEADFSLKNIDIRTLDLIKNCDLDTEILAIKKTTCTGQLVKLTKTDITYWQIFLRFFGLGILGSVTTDLKIIAESLAQYEWAEASDKTAELYPTYLKVCELANKALISKNSEALYQKVSTTSIDIPIKMKQENWIDPRRTIPKKDYTGLATFSLNPKCRVEHILHIASMHFVGMGKLFFTNYSFGDPVTGIHAYHCLSTELHALNLQKGDSYILYRLYAVGESTKTGLFRTENRDTIEDVCEESKKTLRFNKSDPHPIYGDFI